MADPTDAVERETLDRPLQFKSELEAREALNAVDDRLDRIYDEMGPDYHIENVKSELKGSLDERADAMRLLLAQRDDFAREYDLHWLPIVKEAQLREARAAGAALRERADAIKPRAAKPRMTMAALIASDEAQAKLAAGGSNVKLGNVRLDDFYKFANMVGSDEVPGERQYQAATVDSGDAPTRYPLIPGITLMPQEPLGFLDLFPTIQLPGQDVMEEIRETTHTAAAAARAETGTVAEATLVYAINTTALQEVSEAIPITRRTLTTRPYALAAVTAALTGNVMREFENQVLNGNGTPPQLQGITGVTGRQTQARQSDTNIDAIRKLRTKMRKNNGGVMPTIAGVTPDNLQTIELEKETTTAGAYRMGAPGSTSEGILWRMMIVESTRLTANTGVLVAALAGQLLVGIGEELPVETTDSHASHFLDYTNYLRTGIFGGVTVNQPAGIGTLTALN